MSIEEYLKTRIPIIESQLDQLFPEQNVPYNQLLKAARYSLLGAGKRLRPILALATAETFSSPYQQALNCACVLEIIHTYTLIHDDLPCMDDDDMRRGKPTLHKAFTEAHAVLTGDFLLTFAFELLANDAALSAEQKIKIISLLSNRSGLTGMIGGQVMDIESVGMCLNLQTMQQMHSHKTGALITASIECGAIAAGCSEEYFPKLRQFGQAIGLAFQVMDDVLDVTNSESKHGKKIASDIINTKATYVSLLGLEESQRIAEELYHASIRHLGEIPMDTSLLKQLAKRFVYRQI